MGLFTFALKVDMDGTHNPPKKRAIQKFFLGQITFFRAAGFSFHYYGMRLRWGCELFAHT